MQQTNGLILILIGLFLMFIVVSGKFDLFESFFYQLLEIPLPGPTKEQQANVTKDTSSPVSNLPDIFHPPDYSGLGKPPWETWGQK